MKNLVSWVGGIEQSAKGFYEKAAELFAYDAGLVRLLKELAEDEALHFDLVNRVLHLPDEELKRPSSLAEDESSMREIDSYIKGCARRLDEGELTGDELINFIVTIEFSEFNGLFLYVVNTFTERIITPTPLAKGIHAHKARIERFLSSRPEFARFLEAARRIPDAVSENILIVDDENAFLEALKSFLEEEGNVECASNGAEAMERLAEKSYSAIVTDIDMPVMDGVELFIAATEKFGYGKERFIFITGDRTEKRIRVLRDKGLKCLYKPVSLKEIKKEVVTTLGK